MSDEREAWQFCAKCDKTFPDFMERSVDAVHNCPQCERSFHRECWGDEKHDMCAECWASAVAGGFPRYMMATSAMHKAGDISRDEPDLCVVRIDAGDHYIGEWVTGFGFCRVEFPKATTRELCEDDINHYTSGVFDRSFAPAYQLTRDDLLHRGPVERVRATPAGLPHASTEK